MNLLPGTNKAKGFAPDSRFSLRGRQVVSNAAGPVRDAGRNGKGSNRPPRAWARAGYRLSHFFPFG
jgi:hypothetical protein